MNSSRSSSSSSDPDHEPERRSARPRYRVPRLYAYGSLRDLTHTAQDMGADNPGMEMNHTGTAFFGDFTIMQKGP